MSHLCDEFATVPNRPTRPRGPAGPRKPSARPPAGRSAGEDRPARPRPGGGAKTPRPPSGEPSRGTDRRSPGRPARDPAKPRKPAPVRIDSAREDGLHRIAKLLARAGVASRRDIERMIADGHIALNGEVVTTPATLLADLTGVTVNGRPVDAPETARLFLFHKPNGVLTAERDFSGRPTIYSVLPEGLPRLMPVGRLDLNTEGLLLLTNDGALKRALELPSSGVERTYRARTFGDISQAQLEELAEGVTVEGVRYGRIDANLERRTGRNQWVELTLTEGKNREVRRVLEYLGLRVGRLIRTRYGPFTLGESAPGSIAEVKPAALAKLVASLPKPR